MAFGTPNGAYFGTNIGPISHSDRDVSTNNGLGWSSDHDVGTNNGSLRVADTDVSTNNGPFRPPEGRCDPLQSGIALQGHP